MDILSFIIVGFFAQLVDGCLGMAYGVLSNSFLISLGVPSAASSASVHFAKIFTTGVSGAFHFKLGNVDNALFKELLFPGVLGGILGAYLLVTTPSSAIKPFIASYLILMGITIIYRAFKGKEEKNVKSKLFPLGLTGGFFDAIGGGGWGPIVTSTLVARGNNIRKTIGSVNSSEFIVTLAQSTIFFLALGTTHLNVILGLIIGGVIAAPFAAIACKKLPHQPFMILIGVIIIILNIKTVIQSELLAFILG